MVKVSTHKGDLIEILTRDHHVVNGAFSTYERGGVADEHCRALVDHMITELVRHFVAEEHYLYPTVRKGLPNGAEVADRELEEHADAEQLMKELETLQPSNTEFHQKAHTLIADLRKHVEGEERDVFPRLQLACSPGGLRDLGDQIVQMKERAPTRPHPSAPDEPPANTIVDPGVGLVDRMRDALSGR